MTSQGKENQPFSQILPTKASKDTGFLEPIHSSKFYQRSLPPLTPRLLNPGDKSVWKGVDPMTDERVSHILLPGESIDRLGQLHKANGDIESPDGTTLSPITKPPKKKN